MSQPTRRRFCFALGIRGVLGAAAGVVGKPCLEAMLFEVLDNHGTKGVYSIRGICQTIEICSIKGSYSYSVKVK